MNVASRSTHRTRSRQQGNTLVGIIIGLVIGLVIAVIVALAITKGATPFTDKGKAGKAVEPSAGQVSDPNKPMYGNKEAAREAARDFSQEPREAAAPKEATAPKEVKEASPPKEVKESKPAPAADPLQQVIASFSKEPLASAKPDAKAGADKARQAAAPAKAETGDEKAVYYLQIGAFRETADAESARAKLALLGFEANVSDRSTDNGVLHRVRLGPYNQAEAMNRARGKLADSGVSADIVRIQK
ncbi:SPOR domain-containing protein [Janthinobacterium sp.]|uniref:SPOR domain-containing protein n=1 Tax=Janthinobacterium sp. TaxID=1871054 RepID=UPI00293D9D5A|nr:SPOR domain-containing protein [Janthinobacterium sp.]